MYVVHGEGVFVELDETRLTACATAKVQERAARLASNYATVQNARQLRDRELTPRFVLLHTIAHLLMNQLTFECGYSSAALRERLYVSDGPHPMAGVLLYGRWRCRGDDGRVGLMWKRALSCSRYRLPSTWAAVFSRSGLHGDGYRPRP